MFVRTSSKSEEHLGDSLYVVWTRVSLSALGFQHQDVKHWVTVLCGTYCITHTQWTLVTSCCYQTEEEDFFSRQRVRAAQRLAERWSSRVPEAHATWKFPLALRPATTDPHTPAGPATRAHHPQIIYFTSSIIADVHPPKKPLLTLLLKHSLSQGHVQKLILLIYLILIFVYRVYFIFFFSTSDLL